MASRSDLIALRNLISEAELTISTTDLPQGRGERSLELLRAALSLTDDLISQAKLRPAVVLGSKGGTQTSKLHGAEHYSRMAAARKTRGGGRPRKKTD